MRSHDVPILIAPPFSFSVDYLVSAGAEEGQRNIVVRFSVRNNQEHSTRVGLDYKITRPGEDPEPDMGKLARSADG